MRVFSALLLSAALTLPMSMASAQVLPGTPPAFTLTQADLDALLASCRAGGCAGAVQAILAAARAAGLSVQELDAIIQQVATSLVEAARQDPQLAAEVSNAIEVTAAASSSAALSQALLDIVAAIDAGQIDTIDLTALAQAIDDGGDAPEFQDGGANLAEIDSNA